ncbi:MAG: DNA-binding protein [Planctomycetota bacterium]|nr:MAG: DNA-binding protein [Planctomycetota bacterium]
MAKMFYTLEETASKLGMSVEEVQQLASSGQLQEFRDRDKLMFKVDQVDLLAGGGDDAEEIPLADSGDLEPIGLSSSGTGSVFAIEDPKDQTGVSIFEPDSEDDADPSAQTQVSPGMGAPSYVSDSGSSGSGLMDFTREPDDTSLGADLLEDVYSSSGSGGSAAAESAIGGSAIGQAASGELFEPAGGQAEMKATSVAPMGMLAGAEAYDGPWSGIVGGLALGMVVLLALALAVAIFGMTGAAGAVLSEVTSTVRWGIVGGGAGLMIIAAIIGWVALRRS